MADEPTAIRHPRRGKAHRSSTEADRQRWGGIYLTGSGRLLASRLAGCKRWAEDMTERVPLSSVPTRDLCRTCWLTTKDVTP